MCKCRSHGTFPLFGLQSSHLKYLLLPPRSAPTAAPPRLTPKVLQATAAPSYSSGPGTCPDGPGVGRALKRHPFSGLVDSAGEVSAQFGTVTRLPVHPASPVLLTKNGPLGALDSVARLNEAASDERFARQYRCGPPPEFPLASPRSGIVHHLLGSRQACSHSNPSQKIKTPWSVFQDGPEWGAHRPVPGARRYIAETARAANHDRRDGISTSLSTARALAAAPIRTGPRPESIGGRLSPFHIRPGRIAGPHSLPSRQFQALFDSLFKVLFIFPSQGTCLLSVSRRYLALDGIYRPIGGCIPKQPDSQTAPRGATGSGHDGALTLSGAPFRGLGPGPPLRTLLQTTIRTARPPDFQAGLIPVRSPLLRESLFSGILATSPAANRPRRRDPNTSPDHSIGRSDGRLCTKGQGRSQRELMTRAY
ncbi:hypothetical protein L2E82_51484 [Cichorium intybus]|nr:hypothetical protein L2E82_51484 [Cichorium intybus]